MTAVEAYELTTRGGASDFARIVVACEAFGPYCLIGGLAVNCYVEPVYTLDADLVVVASSLTPLTEHLKSAGFRTEVHAHSVNVFTSASDLRIQFTTDPRCQPFLERPVEFDVLGVRARVACIEDVTRGKFWDWSDPQRRLSERKKDELDLIRLAEAHPELISLYPAELRRQLDCGCHAAVVSS